MPRAELLRRLKGQSSLSAETCFVLLWTYLDQSHVAAGENLSRSRRIHPFKLEGHMPGGDTLPHRLIAAFEELQALDGDAFDLYSLRWLKALDTLLYARQVDRLGEDWIVGLDGVEYKVRRRNHFLAKTLKDQVTTKKDQSGTRDLYTPFQVAVPRDVAGILINSHSDWGDASLHNRLQEERERLRVLLWPFHLVLDYPALDKVEGAEPQDFVRLTEVRNEAALQAEVHVALEKAKELEVTLLVFPELSIPPATQEEIRRILESHGLRSYPLLTLLGSCLRRTEEGDVNEAVLLGPDGTELHRHRKLTSFTFINRRATPGNETFPLIAEPNKVGMTVSVLESAVGNLMPLICLDFIHSPLREVLVRSHANFFAVPSLSPTTSAHQTAALDLQVSNQASSFISNRSLGGLTEDATSFFRIPCKNGLRIHIPDYQEASYLLFALEDWPAVDKTSKWQVS